MSRKWPANGYRLGPAKTYTTCPETLTEIARFQFLAWPLCRKLSGIFVVQNLEDFIGDFPGGFFWALFPHDPSCLPDPSPKKDSSNRVFQYAQGFEQVFYSALAFFTEFEALVSIFPAALI